MKLARLFDWLDDRINPIVVKELRQAVQSRLVVAVLLLALGLQVLLLGVFLIVREARHSVDPVDWYAGAEIFQVLQGILLCCCILLIPIYTGVRLASERSDSNTDLLFISTLRPVSIIWGKFAAACVLAMLVFSACAPFMTFTYLLRGIDIPSILVMLFIDVLALVFGTMGALFLAAIPANRALKFFVNFLGYIGLVMLFSLVLTFCARVLRFGLFGGEDPWEFWGPLGALTGVTLGVSGLLFFWSVAIISPPSSNRAPAGRIFLLAQWLATGVVLAALSKNLKPAHHGPVAAWLVISVALACLQFLISINERDRWGPRVARTIPRNPLLRGLAFLFYSGSAGGMILATLMATGSLLAVHLWRRDNSAMAGLAYSEHTSKVMFVVALYTFCYAMTGLLLRAYLMADKVRTTFTWLVSALLIGLGSSIPAVIVYVAFSDQVRYQQDTAWWLLTNPFASVYDVALNGPLGGGWDEFTLICFGFTGAWAILVAVLSLPWLLAQVLRFHPPAPRPASAVQPARVPAERASAEVEPGPAPVEAG
jgi:hypothetical protein